MVAPDHRCSPRAALEEYSAWTPGAGNVDFTIVPSDFDTSGPHRLALQTRVRTRGLTDTWQIDLPHLPFNFEFDSRLEIRSLLALPDEHRAERIARSIRLESQQPIIRRQVELPRPEPGDDDPQPASGRDRNANALRPCPPGLPGIRSGAGTLPGRPHPPERAGRQPIGSVRRLLPRRGAFRSVLSSRFLAKSSISPAPGGCGCWLEPDPDRGWTDPDIRSIWPGTIETGWVNIEIVRH